MTSFARMAAAWLIESITRRREPLSHFPELLRCYIEGSTTMKLRKEYIILVTIILALSLYLFLRSSDRALYELPKIPELKVSKISKIEISKKNTTIILNKKDKTWRIGPQGFAADSKKVKEMLGIIEKLTLTALVSESEDYNRYDLNDEKKITIRAWAGDRIVREFDMGKTVTSYQHTFVKLAGDERVYHARENFKYRFNQSVDDLRDKIVLSFNQAQINEIRITKDRESVLLVRREAPVEVKIDQKAGEDKKRASSKPMEAIWQSADGKKADESKLKALLTALHKLECKQYINGRKKEDFLDPIFQVQLKGTLEYTLSIFGKTEKDSKDHPATSSENAYPFLLTDYHVKDIFKDPKEMLE